MSAAMPYKYMQRPRDRYVEDVDDLLAQGVAPARIVAQIGVHPRALARSLYRAQRPDLGRLFNRVEVNPDRRREWSRR